MSKAFEGCGSRLTQLLSMFLLFTGLCILISDYLPADTRDIQRVVSAAAEVPVAEAAVMSALKQSPNPSRVEIRRLRAQVNELISTELEMHAMGDESLASPDVKARAVNRQDEARTSAIQSKSWEEMSSDERDRLTVSKWNQVFALVLLLWSFVLVFMGLMRSSRG